MQSSIVRQQSAWTCILDDTGSSRCQVAQRTIANPGGLKCDIAGFRTTELSCGFLNVCPVSGSRRNNPVGIAECEAARFYFLSFFFQYDIRCQLEACAHFRRDIHKWEEAH